MDLEAMRKWAKDPLLFLAAILPLGILAMCGCACRPRGPVYMPPEAKERPQVDENGCWRMDCNTCCPIGDSGLIGCTLIGCIHDGEIHGEAP